MIKSVQITISPTNEKAFADAIQQSVTLIGEAQNAHAGAIIKVGSTIVYIDGLAGWEENLLGKQIEATGLLMSEKFIPDPSTDFSLPTTGATGNQFVLKNPLIQELSK